MAMLIAAAAVFLGIHLLIAGTPVRDAITGVIGERPYLGLFSLASIAAIAWLVMAYNAASAIPGSAADPTLYQLGPGVHDLGILVVALAFFLGVQGLLLPNPTSVQQEAAAAKAGTVQGVLRITRHPFLWGAALWAAFHTAANGDEASVVFFGAFFLLALFGTFPSTPSANARWARPGRDLPPGPRTSPSAPSWLGGLASIFRRVSAGGFG